MAFEQLTREDRAFTAHVEDLFQRAQQKYTTCFTNFLDLHQIQLAQWVANASGYQSYAFYAGHPEGERRMLGVFAPYEPVEEAQFPIAPLTITFRKEDQVGHRDLLGSLLGREGALGLGWAGGASARMLAQAAGSGAAAAGARVISHDAPCPSAAAWLAEQWALPAVLFVRQEGEKAVLHLFDRRGLLLGQERRRRLEGALLRGQPGRMPALGVGRWETVSGVGASYAADGARRARLTRAPLRRLEVSVPGEAPADRVLAQALESLGCQVRRESRPGVPAFQTLRGGFALTAVDEEGEVLPPEELLAAVALIEYENGGGRVAVPAAAPAAIDTLAAGYHGGALRLGRDGAEAEARYGELPWLRDGIFAACRICARLGMTGERLRGLTGKLPRFAICRREVPLRRDGEEVLARLLRELPGARAAGEGLRLRQGEGWLTLSLRASPAVLRVVGEARTAELARELCDFCARKAEEAARPGPEK